MALALGGQCIIAISKILLLVCIYACMRVIYQNLTVQDSKSKVIGHCIDFLVLD